MIISYNKVLHLRENQNLAWEYWYYFPSRLLNSVIITTAIPIFFLLQPEYASATLALWRADRLVIIISSTSPSYIPLLSVIVIFGSSYYADFFVIADLLTLVLAEPNYQLI